MQDADDMQPTSAEPPRHWLNRTVFGAGLTSAFGDMTYETTNVILPGFLAVLGLPPAILGTVEGIADGLASFTKLGAGYIADKLGYRKALVVIGYGLTGLMQVFMALAVGWPLILVGRLVGWFGKGVRGPLRDAIMAESITPETRGRAFGFHRAADTLGAVIGPLLGVFLLSWAQTLPFGDESGPYRMVFWLTLIPGVLSMLSFAILVQDDRSVPNPKLRFGEAIRSLPVKFRRYLKAVGLFGLGDFAHTLLIAAAASLMVPRYGLVEAAQVAGLLYVGRNVVQTLASYPVGALADRFGHRLVLVAGYGLGASTAGMTAVAFALASDNLLLLGSVFLLAGLYTAVQEALEGAMTADLVSRETRGVGYGVLGAVNGVGDLVSSIAVGVLWTLVSPVLAFSLAAVVMLGGTLFLAGQQEEPTAS
ncbi:MAG: MFS transporter [Planctomycetes bacterium]|nr:MFS transporter [Planctomycetota bacterium]